MPFLSFPPVVLAGAVLARGVASQFVAGYWPVYNDRTVQSLPYNLLSHVNYFLAATTETFDLDLSGAIPGVDPGTAEQDLKDLVSTSHSNGVTVSLSVGGTDGSVYFSDLVTPQNQSQFASSLLQTVNQYSLDGLDIDWEFPNQARSGDGFTDIYSPQDVPNFITFLSTLRQQFGTSKTISATINGWGWIGADGNAVTDYSGFAKSLDYLTIMLYDVYYPTSNPTTGPNAPLYSTCDPNSQNMISVDKTVTDFSQEGMPASQLVLGVPGYGYEFITASSTLSPVTVNGKTTYIYQTNTQQAAPHESITYAQLISLGYLSADGKTGGSGYTRYWDDCTETPFLFNPSTKSFISYDDAQSYTLKAQYAKNKGLKGVVIFDLSHDDSSNTLVNALAAVLPKNDVEQAASKREVVTERTTVSSQSKRRACRWE